MKTSESTKLTSLQKTSFAAMSRFWMKSFHLSLTKSESLIHLCGPRHRSHSHARPKYLFVAVISRHIIDHPLGHRSCFSAHVFLHVEQRCVWSTCMSTLRRLFFCRLILSFHFANTSLVLVVLFHFLLCRSPLWSIASSDWILPILSY